MLRACDHDPRAVRPSAAAGTRSRCPLTVLMMGKAAHPREQHLGLHSSSNLSTTALLFFFLPLNTGIKWYFSRLQGHLEASGCTDSYYKDSMPDFPGIYSNRDEAL